jgi:hypothetical protein
MSTADWPRAPKKISLLFRDEIISFALSRETGASAKAMSFITSAYIPPIPNITIGPNTGSILPPNIHSMPPFNHW